MRGIAIRAGVLLAVIGFVSVFLHAFTTYQFSYLMWAEGAQPYLGIGIGIVGLALVFVPLVRRERACERTKRHCAFANASDERQRGGCRERAWEDSTPTVPFARPTWPDR